MFSRSLTMVVVGAAGGLVVGGGNNGARVLNVDVSEEVSLHGGDLGIGERSLPVERQCSEQRQRGGKAVNITYCNRDRSSADPLISLRERTLKSHDNVLTVSWRQSVL